MYIPTKEEAVLAKNIQREIRMAYSSGYKNHERLKGMQDVVDMIIEGYFEDE